MFGKGLYIRDLFAKINFDFREEIDINSNQRWSDRFTLIGLGEGAESGFPKILAAWNEQSWRTPELKEETNLSQVSLKLWMISMLLEESLESLKSVFGKAFNSFNKDEVLILATAYLESSVNKNTNEIIL